ncbi:MAG TPA: VTT domain-containing protein [Planctomycetaceae bacterium]|nr:VTT domain-containing protein [Planctomycetaceae bacterium]
MKRKLLILSIFGATIGAAAVLFHRYGTFEQLVRYETQVRSFLEEHAVLGLLIGFVSYFLLSLIPGTAGKSVIYGWLFGFWQGIVIVDCALTAAAVVTFLLIRSLLRESLRSRFMLVMERLDKVIERDGAFYLFALRMMHAPFTATNYAMGATSLDLKSFWWATQLGLIPGSIVFVFAGTQIPTLEEVVQQGAGAVFSTNVILALVLVGLFPLALRWSVRRYWGEKVEHIPDVK